MSFNKAKALKTASKYVQQGKYPAAIEEYRKIIQAEPSDITTLNTLGDLCVKVGDTAEAIRSFVRIAEHYRTGGFNLKAIAMFKKVSKLDPANIEIGLKLASLYAQQKLMVDARHQYLTVAEHYLQAGRNKEALGIYQKIADLDPENTTIQLKLAEAYLREQQTDQAYEAFIAAAGELQRQNKHEDALQTYLRALKTKPDGQAALSAAVNLYTLRGEAQRASALIKHLLGARPDDDELLIMLGRVHQAAEEMDEAEAALSRAVELNPAHFQYLVDLASFFTRRNELDRALQQFDRLIETLHERREEEKAIALLHEVITRDSNHLGALERLAGIYSRLREDHNLIETLSSLADAAIRKGEDDVALATLRQLISLEPDEIKHRRRLRNLGLSEEEMQRLNEPTVARIESQSVAPPVIAEHLPEFETAPVTSAVTWGEIPADEFEIQLEAPAIASAEVAAAHPEFEVSIAGADSGYEFAFSDEEMVDVGSEMGAQAQPVAAPEQGFETAAISEIDLSDDLMASSSQSFLESYLSEDEEAVATNNAMGQVGAEFASLTEQMPVSDAKLREEIESVDFYIAQGMFDVAGYSLDALAEQFPLRPEVEAARGRLTAAQNAMHQASTPVQSSAPTAQEHRTGAFESFASESFASMMPSEPETETLFIAPSTPATGRLGNPSMPTNQTQAAPASSMFDDLLNECSAEAFDFESKAPLAAPPSGPIEFSEPRPSTAAASASDDQLRDILDEFKFVTDQKPSVEDFETHYNLGLAYKEMEMFDDAVEEFQQAFKAVAADTSSQNYLLCCSMLGFCFTQKNLPRLAVMWFKKGLDARGRTEDEYQALRYDLASAYVSLGDLDRAYETFSDVYAIDVNYRGVMAKMRELEEQMAQKA